ncbi:MAG: DNA-binding protein WhiA [Firmicutes bacterium]|nr:DNA-binding protein WhiA [Bacillota bacterium]
MFYTETKGELARIMPDSECCIVSELSAIARSSGKLNMGNDSPGSCRVFEMSAENAAVARKIVAFVRRVFQLRPKVRFSRRRGGLPGNKYTVWLPCDTDVLDCLRYIGVIKQGGDNVSLRDGIPKHLLSRQCCLRAYLRGVFLVKGYVQNPEKEYHMEFMADNRVRAEKIVRIASSFNVVPRIGRRKRGYMAYVKGGDDVVQLLRVMGAHSAVLTLESVRVIKGVRGDVNRVVNCETANLTKAVNAGLAQVAAIKQIDGIIGLESLPPGLQEIAGVRLANPGMTLKELGKILSPQISKSAVNHRMRRIIRLAQEIDSGVGQDLG